MKKIFWLLALLVFLSLLAALFAIRTEIAFTIRGQGSTWQTMQITSWSGTLKKGDHIAIVNNGLLPIKACWTEDVVDKIPSNHMFTERVDGDTFLAIVGFWDECPPIVDNVSIT